MLMLYLVDVWNNFLHLRSRLNTQSITFRNRDPLVLSAFSFYGVVHFQCDQMLY